MESGLAQICDVTMKLAGLMFIGVVTLHSGAAQAQAVDLPPVPPEDVAATQSVTPRLLVAALRPSPAQRSAGAWLPAFHQARGYIRAIKDATPGWCAPVLGAAEIDGMIVSHLARLLEAAPDKAGAVAAPVIAAALREHFPCR